MLYPSSGSQLFHAQGQLHFRERGASPEENTTCIEEYDAVEGNEST